MTSLIALLQATPGQTPIALPAPTASWEDPITIATVVVAVFTVVSVIVSAFMWSATRQQARISREIFEAAHRPYVAIQELSGRWGKSGDQPIRITVAAKIKNSGSVPAIDVIVRWDLSTSLQNVKLHEQKQGAFVLLPEGEKDFLVWFDMPELGVMDTEKEWLDSKLSVHVEIEVLYFGISKRTYHHEIHAAFKRDERVDVLSTRFL